MKRINPKAARDKTIAAAKRVVQADHDNENFELFVAMAEIAEKLETDDCVIYKNGYTSTAILFGYVCEREKGRNIFWPEYGGPCGKWEPTALTLENFARRVAGYGHGGVSSIEIPSGAKILHEL